jgi:general stress protein 26
MPIQSLAELSKKMREIDFAMLSTHSDGGTIAGRPMSNNGEVEYDGNSFYFTYDHFRTVSDIERDPKVSLAFQGEDAFFVNVEGVAELIKGKAQFKQHWTKGLDRWFPDGVDTKGLTLIKVVAKRIHYWAGEEDGEIKV